MKSVAIAVVALVAAGSSFGVEEFATPLPEGKKGGIVITIDDGTIDHYEIAAPTLEKYGMRGIFNIIGSRVGQPGYMTWDQLRDLVKRGHELGNHTWTHPNLNRVAETGGIERVEYEILHNREVIKQETGFDPITLCYPYNASGPVSEKVVKAHGLRNICYRVDNWGGSFGAKETVQYVERAMREGKTLYALMHGFRPGGGWAPLRDPAQFDEILKTLKSYDDLWLPTYSESVDRFTGYRRHQERLRWEADQLSRYARMAVRAEVQTKGGWNAVRKCGDEVEFTVSFRPCASNIAHLVYGLPVKVTLDNFGTKSIAAAETTLTTNSLVKLKGTLAEPGFLRLTVAIPRIKPNFGENFQKSVAFEPERIAKVGEIPADFDAFWSESVQKCAEIPLDARCELIEKKSQKDYDHYAVSFATVNNRRVYGYLMIPKDKSLAPFPLRIQVPGAGIGGWSLWPHPPKGQALLFMTVFPWAPSDDTGWQNAQYKKMIAGFKKDFGYEHYFTAGLSKSREDEFYYPVILGINRAVDWAAARDDIDKEKVTYYGISQGGGFGLYLAGLRNRSIRKYVVNVPGFSDLLCEEAGRQTCVTKSFYTYDDPAMVAAAKRNAPYFDTANFASRVQAPIRFVTGACDWVCPPHTVYAAYNLCSSRDKKIVFNGGDHNSSPDEAAGKAEKWLAE